MTHSQLQQDLDVLVSDAELLTRHQISTICTYLNQALRYSGAEIRALLEDVLATTVDEPPVAMSRVVSISSARSRMVN